jgi:hypothetical protein
MQRGYQLVDMAKPVTLDKGDDGGFWSLAENSDCYHANGRFLHALQYLRVQPADAGAEEEIRAFRALSLRRHQERFREFAGRVGPNGTERLTRALHDRYEPEFGLIAPDPSAAAKAVRESLNIWLDLTRKLSANTFPTDSARLFGERVLPYLYSPGVLGQNYTQADRELSLPIFKALEEHPYPVIRLYAAHWQSKQLLKLGNITRAEAEKRHRRLIEEAKGWIDKAPFKNPAPHRIAFYDLLAQVLKDPPRSEDQKVVERTEDYFVLAEFMLQRRDVVAGPLIQAAVHSALRREDHARALDLISRMRQMVDNPPHRLFSDPQKRIEIELDRAQGVILKVSPHLDKQRTLPWDKVTTLAEAKAIPQAHVLMAPLREGRHVYFFAGSVEPGSKKPYLQLVRAPLDGGKPQLLGKAFVTFKDLVGRDAKAPFNRLPRFVTECVIHRERLYAGTVGDGIYVFPLAGGDGVRIGEKEGLPAPAVVSLAALQDKLFAVLKGGYIVMHDLETKRTEVIASSRRTEALSPFDNAKPFYADNLRTDPPRRRVLFRMYQTSNQHPLSGMWEYNLKTRQFKKLLPLAFYLASPVQDGNFYMDSFSEVEYEGKPGWKKQEGLGRFDLAKDKFTLLLGKSPDGIDEQKPAGIPAQLSTLIRPLPGSAESKLYHGGYLWLSAPFSRTPIKGGKKEILPHVQDPRTLQVQFNECLEAVSQNELLVGDWRALYLVRLKGLAPQ